uniref:Uncharacterized protein n=1 Tax=Schizaphis graminum TaxID=13262 RepID=A0A2S2PJF7_SCHGA
MFSKRMVISMIVIGCLVQFMACIPERTQSQSSDRSRKPIRNTPSPATKPSTNRPIGTSKPRGLQTPTNGGSTGKIPTRKLSRTPTELKKSEADNENDKPQEEQPISGFRKALIKLSGIRKYLCPFKLARKVYGKGKLFGSRMLKSVNIKSTNDNADNSVPNQNDV